MIQAYRLSIYFFGGVIKSISETYNSCSNDNGGNNDRDNDGIADLSDNCPDDPNNDQADSDNDGIGDVCDSTNNNAKPDLTNSYANLSSTDGTTYVGGENLPKLTPNSSINLDVRTKNVGDKQAGQFYVELFVNRNSTSYNPSSDYVAQRFVNTLVINETDYWSDYVYVNQNTHIFNTSGYYYFHFVIDRDNSINNESNEGNNKKTLKVYYYHSGNRPGLIKPWLELEPGGLKNGHTTDLKPYELNIYNFTGVFIKKVTIKNEIYLKEPVNNTGFYFFYFIYLCNESLS